MKPQDLCWMIGSFLIGVVVVPFSIWALGEVEDGSWAEKVVLVVLALLGLMTIALVLVCLWHLCFGDLAWFST